MGVSVGFFPFFSHSLTVGISDDFVLSQAGVSDGFCSFFSQFLIMGVLLFLSTIFNLGVIQSSFSTNLNRGGVCLNLY